MEIGRREFMTVFGGLLAELAIRRSPAPSSVDVVSKVLHEAFGKPRDNLPESRFSPPMQIIRRDWQSSRGLLPSFRVSSLPEDLATAGCPAAQYTASYEFRHRDLPEPRTVRVRTVAVQHHERYYLLRLIDTEGAPFDFSPFLETVRCA